jgi:cobaltochelatase CobS
MTIETTIRDVLQGEPFNGATGLDLGSDTRPALRTWLCRMGWPAMKANALEVSELVSAYTDHSAYCALTEKHAEGKARLDITMGQEVARAPYSPRNEKLIAYLSRRGINGATRPPERAHIPWSPPPAPVTDVVDQNERAAPRIPSPDGMGPQSVAPSTDDAAQLAAILARMAGAKSAPLDEARVIELIRQHAPDAPEARHVIEIRNGAEIVTIEGAQHPKLKVLATVMASRMTNGFTPNVMLVGPTGSGKTHAVEQLAKAMGREFYLHGAMAMSHELMGFKDAGGNYHRTPFRDAFELGGVVLLDELDSWDSQVTLALNAALANGVASFPDGMVRRHVDCLIVGAGNTHGTGPTAEFVGRNRLDAAFLSRFPVRIDWPRDPAIEKAIASNASWVARVMRARANAERAGIKTLIDPRHSQAGAALIASGMDPDMAAEITYLAGLTPAQRQTVEG